MYLVKNSFTRRHAYTIFSGGRNISVILTKVIQEMQVVDFCKVVFFFCLPKYAGIRVFV